MTTGTKFIKIHVFSSYGSSHPRQKTYEHLGPKMVEGTNQKPNRASYRIWRDGLAECETFDTSSGATIQGFNTHNTVDGSEIHRDVSANSGFSPQIIHYNRVFHYKPSIFGYHLFLETPIGTLLGTNISYPKGTLEDDVPFPRYVILPWRVVHSTIYHNLPKTSKRWFSGRISEVSSVSTWVVEPWFSFELIRYHLFASQRSGKVTAS